MQRGIFIKNLLALGAVALLPKKIVQHYQKIYLLQCFVAGFRFYNGMQLLNNMNVGDMLALKREPNNEYDDCAIALYWNNEKIGFIPSSDNEILSRLIDANALELLAEITHLNKQVQPWENLCIAVSFLKDAAITTNDAAYLTTLSNPNYYSYKHNDGNISKVVFNMVDDCTTDTNNYDWHSFLVNNSKNDDMYDIIHSSTIQPMYAYGEQTGDYLIVNKNTLPNNITISNLVNLIEQTMGQFNELFNDSGYIVMGTTEAQQLVSFVKDVDDVCDKIGRHYIELKF